MTGALATPTAELALWMIDLLTSDDRVHRDVRAFAASQRAYVTSQADLVLRRLDSASMAEARRQQGLTALTPTTDLCRCVTVPVFFDWHLDRHIRADFTGPEDYRRYLEAQADPGAVLFNELSTDTIVFSAQHSWMIPKHQIAALDGLSTLRAINAPGPPPLVVFVMSRDLLRQSGVLVRVPLAVDAIPRRNRLYSRFGLGGGRTELIDDDIPRAVIEAIEWRP